jgi:hypothetical protein
MDLVSFKYAWKWTKVPQVVVHKGTFYLSIPAGCLVTVVFHQDGHPQESNCNIYSVWSIENDSMEPLVREHVIGSKKRKAKYLDQGNIRQCITLLQRTFMFSPIAMPGHMGIICRLGS